MSLNWFRICHIIVCNFFFFLYNRILVFVKKEEEDKVRCSPGCVHLLGMSSFQNCDLSNEYPWASELPTDKRQRMTGAMEKVRKTVGVSSFRSLWKSGWRIWRFGWVSAGLDLFRINVFWVKILYLGSISLFIFFNTFIYSPRTH